MSFIDFELIDIPIEFKEINPSDFDSKYYNVEEKITIEPNKEGYISDSLLPTLKAGFDIKSTVVINAGVGQGKSRAILEMVKEYSTDDNYIVILAVPYQNLIEQYLKDCLKFTNRNQIFSQLHIEEETISNNLFAFINDEEVNNTFSISKFNIHILTTNGLLGNSGENSLFQAKIKQKYYSELQSYCIKNNKKIVIVLDEIHDSIYNFKEDLIINLWNYQDLVHKIVTVSATYNEASKEVIKYLSELTDRKIQIIESKRTIIPKKQSELLINFYSDPYVERDKSLLHLIKKLKETDSCFDMMVYSSSLIKKFISKPAENSKFVEVNQLLHGLDINRCYYDMFDIKSNQKYNPNKINIGTNFSTGINIEKLNHNYIIIFPKDVSIEYFNNKGVFTNGTNTIIQALARQRKKGKIHIFLPEPLEIDEDSLVFNSEIKSKILSNFQKLGIWTEKKVNYSQINKQGKILDKLYTDLFKKSEYAIKKIDEVERPGMNPLSYPKKEIFKLYKGENYLAENFFNGNISTYIIWAAMCNQFLNCRLGKIHISNKIRLSSGNLENEILHIYDSEKKYLNLAFKEFSLFNSFSAFEKYENFRSLLFERNKVLVDDKQLSKGYSDKINFILLKLIFENNLEVDKSTLYFKYLNSAIHFSNEINLEDNQIQLSVKDISRIELFKEWSPFVELLEKIKRIRKKFTVLPSKVPDEFGKFFANKEMELVLKRMMTEDLFLSNKNFPFYERFRKCKTNEQFASSFYRLLIEVIYKVSKAEVFKENKENISLYVLNNSDVEVRNLINIIHTPIPEFTL